VILSQLVKYDCIRLYYRTVYTHITPYNFVMPPHRWHASKYEIGTYAYYTCRFIICIPTAALENSFKMFLCRRMIFKILNCTFGSQDELWGNCSKKIKLDTACLNGTSGSATAAAPTYVNNGALELGIRRSARNRRPRGELIVVSSNDTLLDLKMKVSRLW